MQKRLDKRLQEDMPPCSDKECGRIATHLIVTKDSLKIYSQTKDRRDIRMWAGCADHYQFIAQATRWEGVDVQVVTARALLHLGEVEAV